MSTKQANLHEVGRFIEDINVKDDVDINRQFGEFIFRLKKAHSSRNLGFQIKDGIKGLADRLLGIMFPQLCERNLATYDDIYSGIRSVKLDLMNLISLLVDDSGFPTEGVAQQFVERLPEIYDRLRLDAEAINNSDPASVSVEEVILVYPGFTATAIYRFAHELFLLKVPVIPRLLSEYAHQITGIDIHPGAKIGTSLAIDHGTGIVIGETSVIGNNVKLYQGVTLGAASVEKQQAKSKRHPTVEDDVVIYAQAVILGGDTIVGHHSIIGGNVFLTKSVAPYSVVCQENRTFVRTNRSVAYEFDFSI
jgi:serine O-acetyltransferase